MQKSKSQQQLFKIILTALLIALNLVLERILPSYKIWNQDISFGFIAIAFANTVKKIINYNIGLSVSAIVFVISLLAQYLGEQMIIISLASFIGSVLSMIVGEIANTYYRFAFIVDEQGNKRKNKAKAMTLKEIWSETVFSLKDEIKK